MKDDRFLPRFCLFPGYKYCGPGCSGPGEPLNAVDAACKRHDECYRYYGDYCACDLAFLQELERLQNPYTIEGRHARKMYNYMRFQRLFTCGFR
ncbi:phospholipase [Halobacillus locisalis]|uniref:Phospholipase n=1 Tax=Halobacillus locisalis TaxID=220753 RepID=A0A838CYC0_9BACI|nr:phospholipase [Halobacillus locisalis]MBA2176576.1 phospholipase [Halobacillus locisalis]